MSVATEWNPCDATAAERTTFATLAGTLALASEPAAPPNANRTVRRITTAHGTYFLKCFAYTQWKNQLRNLTSAPRCRLDAERELGVARALAARGVAVARVVAVGRERGASWYLCAALAGTPLSELVARRELAPAAARFLGGILAAGVTLPDLALEHVFLLDTAPTPRFAILDLHNGAVRKPRRHDLVRALRRLARSARGLAIGRHSALRFAVRLLASAGWRERLREILVRVPPFDTHGRYDVAGRSSEYADRNRARHDRELALLRRVWPGRAGDLVLDLPCGSGRLREFVGSGGARWIGADRSLAMLRLAGDPRVLADATEIPFADRATDGVIVFRFLHHLGAEGARHVLREAARVARRFVVVSHFHPVSGNAVRRSWRRRVLGHEATRFALWPSELDRVLAEHGFRRSGAARDGFLHELRVAAYVRDGAE